MKVFKNDLTKILKDGTVGDHSISHFTITQNDFRAVYRGGVTPNKEYVRLTRGNTVVMSDTQMEKWTNREIVSKAKGDVLIAGLGLGMILLEIQDKPEVTSVTVVELSKDVIELVGSQLPLNEKVTIINGDIFDILSEFGDKVYDTIYFDIWDSVSEDEREEMRVLESSYSVNLRSNGYINSWFKEMYDHPELWRDFDEE